MPTASVERLVLSFKSPNADKPLEGQVANNKESRSGKKSGDATPKSAQKQGDVGTSTRASGAGLKPPMNYNPPAKSGGRMREGRFRLEGSRYGGGDDWLKWFRW